MVRFLVAAAFFPAATRFGDFRVVAFLRAGERAVDFFRADVAFRVARFLVAAAFLPAATRFGDFRDIVVRRAVVFLAPVRLRVAAAFFAAPVRLRVAAAFLAGPVRFRVVAAFRAAVLRFRVVAAFLPAATRFVALPVVRGLGVIAPMDGADGIVLSASGIGRSLAGIAGCHDGSVRVGASSELSSAPLVPSPCSSSERPSSLHGQSRSCDGMQHLPLSGASRLPLPSSRPKDAEP